MLEEGGHVAEIADRSTGLNPLWTPPWPSIEPSAYDPAKHPEYGTGPESRLLAGICGHNLCLDLFGGPSAAESAAGLTVHGEASVVPYELSVVDGELISRCSLPMAQLRFERRLRIDGQTVRFRETLENLSAYDRPIAWTQHVTLGPPFLARGETQFRASATRGKVYAPDFTEGKGRLAPGAEFDWPHAPRIDASAEDLRVYPDADVSAGFTAQLMDPAREQAWWVAWSPAHRTAFGYVWRRADFPWLGIWDENHSREQPPWNGCTLTRGMEFGASPFPETRREMIQRGSLFGEPAYRWIPAQGRLVVEYAAFLMHAESIPEEPVSCI